VIAAAPVQRQRPLTDGAVASVAVGAAVQPEQLLATRRGANGKLVPLLAGLAGRVTQVLPGRALTIEGMATAIYGLVGLGGSAAGPLHPLAEGEAPESVTINRGEVLVYPGQVSAALVQRAVAEGAAGIVAASIAARDLEALAQTDLTAVLDGLTLEAAAPLTIVCTEGLGRWTMDAAIHHTLAQRAGAIALLDGTTNPRRGIRPEVLLALPADTPPAVEADDTIEPGARVRVVAGAWRGATGEVLQVQLRQQLVEPGLRLRCAQVRVAGDTRHAIPLAFLERVG
jgi:hypothetical protein